MPSALLGQKLKALRLNNNLTQQAAAERLGTKSKCAISMWENGVNEPGAITFLALCVAYEMPEAVALVKALGIENEAAFDFGPIAEVMKMLEKQNSKPTAQITEKKPYTFCPYCGEKLE